MRLAGLVYAVCAATVLAAQAPEQIEFFEKNVRPVLASKCQSCHNQKTKMAGIDFTTGAGLSEPSLVTKAVGYEGRLKMPPAGKLPAEEIAAIERWVAMGAPWPGRGEKGEKEEAGAGGVRRPGTPITGKDREFWSFQKVSDPAPPAVRDTAWVKTPVDRFILAKLEEKGLKPSPPASKTALLRRATFDLTGLPPTEQEIRDFLADESPEAFQKVVDRLLASPRYGERWGRHWLDVARYADSTGNDEDHRYPYAWRYRDYVIEAFNNDLPYNQFLREQIAGDLLPAPDGGAVNRRGIIATGFLALGAKAIAQQDKQKMLYDVYDEQLDVTTKGILGVTLACARCHDHKFDPFSTKDYYSLINFFANTRSFKDPEAHVSKLLYVPLVPREQYARYQEHLDKISGVKLEIEDLIELEKERYNQRLTPRLADYMLAARGLGDGAGLDGELVARWKAYLGQDWRKKPDLEQWQKASDAEAAKVARAYQARYEQTMANWSEKLRKWREQRRRMLAEMNMPPPPKPQFKAEEDGFFYDVYVAANGPFAVGEKDEEKVFSAEGKARLAELKAREKQLKESLPPEPEMACGVEDGEAVEQRVFIRGDYNHLGEPAPKGFPAVLVDAAIAVKEPGSGRRELAEWLASADNPLTARVFVNRVWQKHFGEGIVRTPDNFGVMGERPTHPELLDWLASRFVENNWSVKSLHRLMMLSATYQMASTAGEEALKLDPENRLFSRFNRRRLDVEEIRDGMLAVSGAMDTEMGGTLQQGFGTDGENSQDRLSINPDNYKRRTVYLPLRRANLPALLNLFDFGDATTATGKRVVTNVAPQALFMMNSAFLTEQSGLLAKALMAEGGEAARRVERAYWRVLNRQPEASEVDAALSYVGSFQSRYGRSETEAWQSLCRVLLAANEFVYVD
jgi:cytochrome c553